MQWVSSRFINNNIKQRIYLYSRATMNYYYDRISLLFGFELTNFLFNFFILTSRNLLYVRGLDINVIIAYRARMMIILYIYYERNESE